jgi:signal transduction histidine kinase
MKVLSQGAQAPPLHPEISNKPQSIRVSDSFSRSIDLAQMDYIASLAHEVRTPLTSLLMGLHLLAGGTEQSESRERWLRLCISEGERLRTLVEQLLSSTQLSLLDPRLQSGENLRVDLAHLVRVCLERVENEAASRGISVELSGLQNVHAGRTWVLADPIRMSWALEQSLLHFLRHTRRGASLQVGLERRGPAASEFWVSRLTERPAWAEQDETPEEAALELGFGLGLAREFLGTMHAPSRLTFSDSELSVFQVRFSDSLNEKSGLVGPCGPKGENSCPES